MDLIELSRYTRIDTQKMALIEDVLSQTRVLKNMSFDMASEQCCDMDEGYLEERLKRCPKCGKEYLEGENFCFDCLVSLNDIKQIDIKSLDMNHEFTVRKTNTYNSFEDIFTTDNLIKINDFDFERKNFNRIIKSIKSTALKSIDTAIKENDIDLDELSALEKVLLFAKAFVDVEYKSYGQELGYYSFNTIYIDDRQLDALQITTLLHELTHFLLKEILTQILCSLLDASKTRELESIITFILSYSKQNCLIDEYAAHTVEGRFTLFGYQDYSSFLSIEKEIDMSKDEIEMLKTIGNTFAHMIKTIVESFINANMLKEIKSQFRTDIMDSPDYSQLSHENCTILNYEGFFQAVQFILTEGFAYASENLEKVIEINEMWE